MSHDDASRTRVDGARADAEPDRPAADAGALDGLCRALGDAVGREDRGAVEALLGRYARNETCWRPYTRFLDDRYSRNLVWRCGDFELLLLCWGAGQESPIHDHAGERCWMTVLDGAVVEEHYALPNGAGGPMQTGERRRFERGQVAFIHDDIALHKILPADGAAAVSLHLYAGAIDACRVYDPETGEARRIDVGYDSVRGEACDPASAGAIRQAWSAAGRS